MESYGFFWDLSLLLTPGATHIRTRVCWIGQISFSINVLITT
jgi:hypothetical protein